MSVVSTNGHLPLERSPQLKIALSAIAAMAGELDRNPRFPTEAFAALDAAGVLAMPAKRDRDTHTEWEILHAVATADASVGRILDGHFNAVARVAAAAPEPVRAEQLDRIAGGGYLLGLWGGDPGPGEGSPAVLEDRRGTAVVTGVKTFCSGAGGVDAALVLAPGPDGGAPWLCLVPMDESTRVDSSWFRGGGLRASESHRVSFLRAPVLAVLGGPGELAREPDFSMDALRTTVTWAGMVDAARAAALAFLRERRPDDELAALAAGRITAAGTTVDLWLARAETAVADGAPLRELSICVRAEVIRAAGEVLDAASRACGSWPFATGGDLDRARRDLELFTLQHRIDPLLQRMGRDSLSGASE